MKLQSPKEIADKIRANGGFKNEPLDIVKVAQDFIEGPVKTAIEIKIAQASITTQKGVNVNLPGPAYSQRDAFLTECNKILAPHYVGEFSHDGVGMHDTLWVTWK